MRLLFVTSVCLAALLAGVYVVHTVRDAKLRSKLNIPASALIRDVGAVKLSADTPKLIHLGGGKDVTVTASIITNEAFLATNTAILMRGPRPITNAMFQMSVAYTSRTDRIIHTEQLFCTGLQDRQAVLCFESESDNPVAAVMTPRLMTK